MSSFTVERWAWLVVVAIIAVVGVAATPVAAAVNLFGFYCCYHVASHSMLPTLELNEKLAALAYAADAGPERGDMVLLALPTDPTKIWIKRIIGLPGDRVQMVANSLYLNDQPTKRERLEDFISTDEGQTTRFRHWRETLPNGASYEIVDLADDGPLADTRVYMPPPGQYFVLGDNRANSLDSRSSADFGFVPADHILGKVVRP